MSRTTVGLVMIVKNEATTLPRLEASLAGQIDYWTIVDTGSTDATKDVARRVFAGVPGQLLSRPWCGYGPSRTTALRAAEAYSDWLLHMDADETFRGSIDRAALGKDVDAVDAECRYNGLSYWITRLVRSGMGWHWKGRAHEYLAMPSGLGTRVRTEAFHVCHHGDGGNRPGKLERELALLQDDWAESPGDPRTAFYLARTYDDAGRVSDAVDWYRRRVALDGWAEETFYARWRLGVMLLAAGAVDEACGVLWQAWGERPWRAEPLATLAEHYRARSQWPLAWEAAQLAFRHGGAEPDASAPRTADSLFVHAEVTAWRIAYEASISAWYVGALDDGARYSGYLLARDDLTPEIRAAVEGNRRFYK